MKSINRSSICIWSLARCVTFCRTLGRLGLTIAFTVLAVVL
jgi:hypothetical protein